MTQALKLESKAFKLVSSTAAWIAFPGQIELQIRSLFPPCGNSQGNPQPEFNLRQNESLDDAKQNRLEI
jgi:hypothetical protein